MLQMDESLTESESINWNNSPLYLSKRELCVPDQVLNDFFLLYTLPEIRTLVKLIFHSSNIDNQLSSEQIFILQNQLIKLIEASWLLYTTNNNIKLTVARL